jgi:hypothetical protein
MTALYALRRIPNNAPGMISRALCRERMPKRLTAAAKPAATLAEKSRRLKNKTPRGRSPRIPTWFAIQIQKTTEITTATSELAHAIRTYVVRPAGVFERSLMLSF